MGYTNKPFEELDILDDFLMNQLAMDENVGESFCRRLISVLLGQKIGTIRDRRSDERDSQLCEKREGSAGGEDCVYGI